MDGDILGTADKAAHNSFKTVHLSQRDIEDAARILSTIVSEIPQEASPIRDGSSPPTRAMMIKRARRTFLNRRRRAQMFGPSLFGEPAWDMLLALYITEETGPRNTIGRLVAFSGVSMTTALRWLDVVEDNGLIQRRDHPTDRRTVLISLSDKGRAALDAYFHETLTEGL